MSASRLSKKRNVAAKPCPSPLTYVRRILGWRAGSTVHAGFVLNALEQALRDSRPTYRGGRVHKSVRGLQYESIKSTKRLAEPKSDPSVGSVGDSYDNASTPIMDRSDL
jgi:putative transposase